MTITLTSQSPSEAKMQILLDKAKEVHKFFMEVERSLQGKALFDPEHFYQIEKRFWGLMKDVRDFEATPYVFDKSKLKKQFITTLPQSLCKSKYWWRSLYKPNGYPGDFIIVEWMYELDKYDSSKQHFQSAFETLMDSLFITVDSVQSIWERRSFLKNILVREFRKRNKLNILDVACGGAIYIFDFLHEIEKYNEINITLLDQDEAALNFASDRISSHVGRVTTKQGNISQLPRLAKGEFDIIISAGLFDYLEKKPAQKLLNRMSRLAKKDGIIAITNYNHKDRSGVVKDWCVDWPLVFRSEKDMDELFNGAGLNSSTFLSNNDSLNLSEGSPRNK